MLLLWMAQIVSAGEPESLEDLWRSVDDLTVLAHLVRRVEAPIFSGRPMREWATLAVRREEQEDAPRVPPPDLRGALDFVGFGFVGEGSLALRLYDRAEPQVLANRQVRELGRAPADFADVARGGATQVTSAGSEMTDEEAMARGFMLVVVEPTAALLPGCSDQSSSSGRRIPLVVYGTTAFDATAIQNA
ncbi:MAG: hypothetical protein H0V89_03355, partial [Deltaproteobacteria bacterium]|nr:hypothetical protein [Deltaproteobacteria bacterium]